MGLLDDGVEVGEVFHKRLADRSDQEIAEDFVAHVRGAGPDEHEQGVLRDAFDAVRADETVREPWASMPRRGLDLCLTAIAPSFSGRTGCLPIRRRRSLIRL